MSRWFKINKKTRTEEVDQVLVSGEIDIESILSKSDDEIDRNISSGKYNVQSKLLGRSVELGRFIYGAKR